MRQYNDLRKDEKLAFDDGMTAYNVGKQYADNPYKPNGKATTRKYAAWNQGFNQANIWDIDDEPCEESCDA